MFLWLQKYAKMSFRTLTPLLVLCLWIVLCFPFNNIKLVELLRLLYFIPADCRSTLILCDYNYHFVPLIIPNHNAAIKCVCEGLWLELHELTYSLLCWTSLCYSYFINTLKSSIYNMKFMIAICLIFVYLLPIILFTHFQHPANRHL